MPSRRAPSPKSALARDLYRRPNDRPIPEVVVGVDPDKSHTALAWALRTFDRDEHAYRLIGLAGGGACKTRVSWSTITGALEWLREVREQPSRQAGDSESAVPPLAVLVVIETQAATSPRSGDVEALRRVRYHWDAACELLGLECEHVDKAAWQLHVTDCTTRARVGEGAIKRAYRTYADLRTAGRTANEDQAAAFGLLEYAIEARLCSKLIT